MLHAPTVHTTYILAELTCQTEAPHNMAHAKPATEIEDLLACETFPNRQRSPEGMTAVHMGRDGFHRRKSFRGQNRVQQQRASYCRAQGRNGTGRKGKLPRTRHS